MKILSNTLIDDVNKYAECSCACASSIISALDSDYGDVSFSLSTYSEAVFVLVSRFDHRRYIYNGQLHVRRVISEAFHRLRMSAIINHNKPKIYLIRHPGEKGERLNPFHRRCALPLSSEFSENVKVKAETKQHSRNGWAFYSEREPSVWNFLAFSSSFSSADSHSPRTYFFLYFDFPFRLSLLLDFRLFSLFSSTACVLCVRETGVFRISMLDSMRFFCAGRFSL